jgi:hypothetical protein
VPAGVVPVAVKPISRDVERSELLFRDLYAGRVEATIQARPHNQSPAIGRVADQVDDGFVRAERSSSPIDGNEREEAVFDLVPLAGSRRKVALREWRG